MFQQVAFLSALVMAVYLQVGAGMLARAVGYLTQDADTSLTRLTVYVLIPCLFFSKVVNDPSFQSFSSLIAPVSVGFLTTVMGFVLAGLVAAAAWKPVGLPTPAHRRAFTLTAGMYNYGYIPLPLVTAMFPAALSTMIVHNVGVEIALWTVGILIISGGFSQGGWKKLLNPPVIAIVVAVSINVVGVGSQVPRFVMKAAADLGACAIPLGLVVSGAVMFDLLREMKLREGLGTLIAGSFIRLGALPILFLLLAKALPVSVELKQVILIQAAMPAAMFPIVVTRLYGQHTETAVRIAVGTAMLGLLTIPIWIAVGQWWLGLG